MKSYDMYSTIKSHICNSRITRQRTGERMYPEFMNKHDMHVQTRYRMIRKETDQVFDHRRDR